MKPRSVLAALVLLGAGCSVGPTGGPSGDDGDGRRPDGGTPGDDDSIAIDVDETLIADRMAEAGAPGLGAAITSGGEVVWSSGYGLANVEDNRPATADTSFLLASISKTVVSVAVMQLVERGLITLDADINTYLAFEVRNPAAPGTPITMRQLLSHTSSLRDSWDAITSVVVQGDSPIALGDFLEGYFTAGGQWYSAAENFQTYGPGGPHDYSNVAVDLAAYVVERMAAQPFDAYCEEHIFAPLGIEGASWHLAGLDVKDVAMPYAANGTAYGHYGYADYPDGLLRATVKELGIFLAAFADGGAYHGQRVLAEETALAMRELLAPARSQTQATVWYYEDSPAGRLLGHSGGDNGVATLMMMRAEDGVGAIVLTNGDWNVEDANYAILYHLFAAYDEAAAQ